MTEGAEVLLGMLGVEVSPEDNVKGCDCSCNWNAGASKGCQPTEDSLHYIRSDEWRKHYPYRNQEGILAR